MTCIKKINPDLIIAVGGGCALDYAKIASVSIFLDNFSIKNFDNNKIKKKSLNCNSDNSRIWF